MSLQEEQIELEDDYTTILNINEYDKLNYVVCELKTYCEQNYLPFFKQSNTFTLLEQLIK